MGVRLGSRIFTGPGALALVGVVLAVIVAAVVWSRPSWWMIGSAEIWIGFIAYWSHLARQAAPIQRSESTASRRQHERLLNLSILLLFLPLPWLSTVVLPLGEWRPLWGLLLQLSGLVLALWARRHLGRNWSAVVAIKVDHSLVQSGPYRLVRHPIYTAMLAMAAGTAVVSGSVHGLLGVALMAVAYARKIPMEEQGMGETFGDAYVEYRRRSWALLPFIL